MLRVISKPTFERDGFELAHFDAVKDPDFQSIHRKVYAEFVPGENASNRLSRGIRWGIYARDQFLWLERREYQLSLENNPEESGRIRKFGLIPEVYLRRTEVESVLRSVYARWNFGQTSYERAYEVMLSAIRYEARLDEPALPSPICPHRDGVDSAVLVMAKTDHLVGGTSRVYSLSNEPRYELDLAVGDVLLVQDTRLLHQVTPILLTPGAHWTPDQPAFRDVLIARFQPVGR